MQRPLLSLAIITGAIDPDMMERFIRSFAPAIDELIIVKAAGAANDSLEVDAVLTRAQRICGELDLRHALGAYYNQPEHADWPHVDNFAAARNVAWGMATGEFLMWADTDDILKPGTAEILREVLRKHGHKADMFSIPYTITDQGITVFRERITRSGIGVWVNPVHECLEPLAWSGQGEPSTPPRVGKIDEVEFIHQPDKARPRGSSSIRNLRIIESVPPEKLTTSLRYHKWQELLAVGGREADGAQAAIAFLEDPKGGPVERMEAFLRLAHLSESPRQKADWLTLAWRECPDRREPLAGLAEIALREHDLKRARAYVNAMKGLPMPADAPWTLRRRWWGWAAVQHEARILRLGDEHQKADALELNHFVRNGGKISLLHATRGRPVQAIEARQRWFDLAENPDAIEHIFAFDFDDEPSHALGMERHVMIPGTGPEFRTSRGPVAAWNAALQESHGKIIIQLSDDWNPPLHWDRLILERLGSSLDEPRVLAVSDGTRRDGLLCMAICTRAALQRPESAIPYLFHPAFFSMFSDNWFTEEMRSRNIVIEAPDLVFEHLHPAFGKAELDATYARSNHILHYATGWHVLEQLQEGAMSLPYEPFTWQNIPAMTTDDSPAHLHARIMAELPDGAWCYEIGVAYGRGIACMETLADYIAERFHRDIGVIGIDTFGGTAGESVDYPSDLEKQCRANLRHAGLRGELWVQSSLAAAASFTNEDRPSTRHQMRPHYVFLDAAHDYASIAADIDAWWPLIQPGGVLAGHDYQWSEDVRRAVDERFPHAEKFGECWFVCKPVGTTENTETQNPQSAIRDPQS